MDVSKIKHALNLVLDLTNNNIEINTLNDDSILDSLIQELEILSERKTLEIEQSGEILNHLLEICTGDFSAKLNIHENDSPLNAIACAINIYSEELLHSTVSQEEYLASLNSLPYVVWSSNIDFSEILFVNAKTEDIFGLSAKAMKENPNLWVDIIHPDDQQYVKTAFDQFLETGDFHVEYRYIHQKSKEVRWINDQANLLVNQKGEKYRIVGSCKDITDRKVAEIELKNNQIRLEEAQKISKVGNWEMEFSSNKLYWSKEHYDIFEIPYEVENNNLSKISQAKIHPEDLVILNELVARTIETGQPFEYIYRIILSSTEIKYIRGIGNALFGLRGEILGLNGTSQDITEGRNQELLLNNTLNSLNSILDATDYSIISTNLTGTIVLFNKGAEKMLGYTAAELINKKSPSLIHDENEVVKHGEKLKNELGIIISDPLDTFHYVTRTTGLPDTNEWTYIHKNGTRIPVELTLTAVKNQHGEIQGYLGIAKDITLEKQREKELLDVLKSLQDYQTALNQIAIVSISDIQGNITFANEKFSEISGYSVDELIGNNHRILKSDKNPPELFEELWKTISSGKTWRGEVCNINKAGDYYWVDTLIVPFLDNQGIPTQYFSIRYEITEKKEQERLQLNNIELQKQKELAEQKTKVKERFLANMSHEIRTPMNSILGLSNLMEKVGTLNPKQMDYMKTIKLNSKNLLNIINDILDLSKIEEGKLELEKTNFDVKELVKNVEKSLHLIAHKKKINLTSTIDESIPSQIIGDSNRLNQVLINLTNNAIKFTNEGDVQLKLHLIGIEHEKVRLKFEVQDTGIGIEPSKLSSIFDPFTQETTSTTRLYGGTGLGLSISNQIIHAFQSQIFVDSEPGIGSTFYFELVFDIAEAQLQEIKKEPINTNELKGTFRILLVEDNPFNQMVAEDTLKDWNGELDIEIAENGIIAIEKLKHNVYDLILMDIQMPEMDGHQTTRIARQDLAIRTPILAMTAQATPAEIEACMHSGMNDFISKPFQEEVLFSKISHWLQTDFLM